MGVILQILGTIITFAMAMEALRRLGIDEGGPHPLAFLRRRAWARRVATPPRYTLEHPVNEGSPDRFTGYDLHTARSEMQGAARITPRAGAQQPRLLEAVGARFARKQAAARPWAG